MSKPYTLGRDPQGDVVVDDARVSWRHATISWSGRSWVIDDHGSTNGTFVQGQRIHQMEICPGSSVHLGNATDGPLLSLSGAAASVASPQVQPQQQPYAAQGAGPGWAQQAPVQQTPEQQQRQKAVIELTSGKPSFDVIHISYHVQKRQFEKGGWLADLTPYMKDPTLTAPDLVESDFSAALEKAMALAKSKDADYLPGWCGPVTR